MANLLRDGEARMSRFETSLKENTDVTAEMKKGLSELMDIFVPLKGLFKVAGWVGRGVRWVVTVGGGIAFIGAALWALLFKSPPPG